MTLHGLDPDRAWDYENGFYWFSTPSRLDKALAHYELYKRIVELPGHIIELGVYKAASLIRFGTFRRLLETDTSRRILAFDAFGGFPRSDKDSAADSLFINHFEAQGGDGLGVGDVREILRRKGFGNIDLVQGDILETLPEYVNSHPEMRIALLHIDTDVYGPSKLAVELLWDRMVPGGIVVFDDYNSVDGETRAVDEFLESKNLRLNKLPFYSIPAFVTKEQAGT